MEPVEKITYNKCTIEIFQQPDSGSPREWDNLGTMYCCHRRYRLGDEQMDPDSIRRIVLNNLDDGGVAMKLYLYDHSGISMSTESFVGRAHQAEWDSGIVGFIIATRQEIYDWFGWKRITQKRRGLVESTLEAEVEEYDQYLRGDVYGYQSLDPEGNDIDSCWGFYGTDWENNGLFEHAKPAIDYWRDKKREELFSRLKQLLSNNVPLDKRQEILQSHKS